MNTYLVHFWEENQFKRDKNSPSIPVAGGLRSVEVNAKNEYHIAAQLRQMGYKPFKIRNYEIINGSRHKRKKENSS